MSERRFIVDRISLLHKTIGYYFVTCGLSRERNHFWLGIDVVRRDVLICFPNQTFDACLFVAYFLKELHCLHFFKFVQYNPILIEEGLIARFIEISDIGRNTKDPVDSDVLRVLTDQKTNLHLKCRQKMSD